MTEEQLNKANEIAKKKKEFQNKLNEFKHLKDGENLKYIRFITNIGYDVECGDGYDLWEEFEMMISRCCKHLEKQIKKLDEEFKNV